MLSIFSPKISQRLGAMMTIVMLMVLTIGGRVLGAVWTNRGRHRSRHLTNSTSTRYSLETQPKLLKIYHFGDTHNIRDSDVHDANDDIDGNQSLKL